MSVINQVFNSFRSIFVSPKLFFLRIKYIHILAPFYQSVIIPRKVKRIRKKEKIDVLFVLNELGSWKTESLYLRMLQHNRFIARILVVPTLNADYSTPVLIKYLDSKHYQYHIANKDESIKEEFIADIIFYQKPYHNIIDERYFYLYHMDSLFCYVLYCFRNRNYPQIKTYDFINFIWQFYAENSKVIEESIPVFNTKAQNMVNTGLPFMDDLLLDKAHYIDPWKKCSKKKRIIYAPHYSICSDIYEYSTFLDYYEFMLSMAEKYCSQVQWAFKPHPLLKVKLYDLWGKQKTDEYYSKWILLENSQIAEGEYMGLFKYSDGMIHDCGSFKLEYLYMKKPVMFLYKRKPEFDYTNWQTEESLKLHYHGKNKEDIENFIVNVIRGIDPLKEKRIEFLDNYLTPPYGKTGCDNIINAILGEAEYQ